MVSVVWPESWNHLRISQFPEKLYRWMKDLWNFQRSTQGKDSLKQSFSTVIWVSIRSKLYCVFNHLYKFCVIRGKNNCFILEKSFNFYGLFLVPKLNKVKQNRSNFYEINFCDFFCKAENTGILSIQWFSEYSVSFKC